MKTILHYHTINVTESSTMTVKYRKCSKTLKNRWNLNIRRYILKKIYVKQKPEKKMASHRYRYF